MQYRRQILDLLEMAEAGRKNSISKQTKPVTSLLQYNIIVVNYP